MVRGERTEAHGANGRIADGTVAPGLAGWSSSGHRGQWTTAGYRMEQTTRRLGGGRTI